MQTVARRAIQPESSPPYRHSVEAQSRGTDRANKQLSWLRVLQAAGENPEIRCHHRYNAKYNEVFHGFTSLLSAHWNRKLSGTLDTA